MAGGSCTGCGFAGGFRLTRTSDCPYLDRQAVCPFAYSKRAGQPELLALSLHDATRICRPPRFVYLGSHGVLLAGTRDAVRHAVGRRIGLRVGRRDGDLRMRGLEGVSGRFRVRTYQSTVRTGTGTLFGKLLGEFERRGLSPWRLAGRQRTPVAQRPLRTAKVLGRPDCPFVLVRLIALISTGQLKCPAAADPANPGACRTLRSGVCSAAHAVRGNRVSDVRWDDGHAVGLAGVKAVVTSPLADHSPNQVPRHARDHRPTGQSRWIPLNLHCFRCPERGRT